MATEKKQVNVPSHTLENRLEINPDKSLLPIILTGDRVIVEPVITEDDKFLSKEANITKPVSAKAQFQKGRIVSIGGGEYGQGVPASLTVGLVVEYFHGAAMDYVVDKKAYHLVRASDIWGLL